MGKYGFSTTMPKRLGERIDEVYEQAGFHSKAELVRDAVRRRLEELEAKQAAGKAARENQVNETDDDPEPESDPAPSGIEQFRSDEQSGD